jgi:hypothetical protein
LVVAHQLLNFLPMLDKNTGVDDCWLWVESDVNNVVVVHRRTFCGDNNDNSVGTRVARRSKKKAS